MRLHKIKMPCTNRVLDMLKKLGFMRKVLFFFWEKNCTFYFYNWYKVLLLSNTSICNLHFITISITYLHVQAAYFKRIMSCINLHGTIKVHLSVKLQTTICKFVAINALLISRLAMSLADKTVLCLKLRAALFPVLSYTSDLSGWYSIITKALITILQKERSYSLY